MTENRQKRRRPATLDAWEHTWQQHWSKAGTKGFELPAGGESDFLAQARTPAKERARLKRIEGEFVRSFKGFTTWVLASQFSDRRGSRTTNLTTGWPARSGLNWRGQDLPFLRAGDPASWRRRIAVPTKPGAKAMV